MDAESIGRMTDALFVARVGLLNVKLLEFFERLVKQDVAIEHVFNYGFEAGANLHSDYVS